MTTRERTDILIVDDEESIRLTFEMFLTREGYGPITTVATIQEALDAIEKNEFQLIISDIVLEGSCGTDLLKKIRATGVECPVVMITGYPNLETAAEAVRHGAFDYVPKPVNKETLLRFVAQALNHWQLQNEKQELQRENERYRRYLEVIFSSVGDAIITVDHKKEIIQMNHTAREWFDMEEGQDGLHIRDLTCDLGVACFHDVVSILENGRNVREHQVECTNKTGEVRLVSLSGSPLNDEEGEFSGVVLIAHDISPPKPAVTGKRNHFHRLIGASTAMQGVYRLIENVGKVDTAVLITGESGTGKELTAEALHAESLRKEMPLVKVDCAAMPEDLLESELFGHRKGAFTGADRDRPGRLLHADQGTLFLDEIGDISPRMQLRLLRFLQEKTFTPVGQDSPISVDVRVIAATNVKLREKVQAGKFREDLYYRLKVVEVPLPPLREREGAIPLLSHYFLNLLRDRFAKAINSISDQAMQALIGYSWPGNVRELQHVMERAVVLCDGPVLSLKHFPEEIHTPRSSVADEISRTDESETVVQHLYADHFLDEEEEIFQALRKARGNKAKAARLLGINRSTLYRKIKRYGIEEDVAKLSRPHP